MKSLTMLLSELARSGARVADTVPSSTTKGLKEHGRKGEEMLEKLSKRGSDQYSETNHTKIIDAVGDVTGEHH